MMSSKETVATAAEALCGKLGLTQGDKVSIAYTASSKSSSSSNSNRRQGPPPM